MKEGERLQIAERSLDRVSEFFSRIDSKASFISALDTGMLALVALNFDYSDVCNWYVAAPGALTTILLFGSLYFIYRCQFPQLKGGTGSKIYFKEIAARTEAQFVDEFLKENDENHLNDTLGQIWRNSEILRQKYDAVKIAFILTAVSIVPWFIFLIVVATHHSALKLS